MAFFRLVPHGPPAALALRDAIADAKRGDPLSPVTVAVPSNYAGLSLRHRLGAEPGGLINVRFIVLARVAELLGAPSLAALGRRPLTAPVRGEAARAALAHDPGIFRDVSEHRATERSLEQTFRDLRQAPEDRLDVVAAQSERAADIVRLYREFRRITADYYDEEDLAIGAAEAIESGTAALRDVGHVVLHEIRRITRAEQRLIEALAGLDRLSVVLGLSGDLNADAPVREVASLIERATGAPQELSPQEPPIASRIVAVADAEEEVRTAIRLVMGRLEGGTPLHRMAVLYPTAQPYALLAHEQLSAAGVPHNGRAVRMLSQTMTGKTLLGVLHLRDAKFKREAVMDWLSAAPVLEEARGRAAPAHRWDVVSRSAGVVGGEQQWRDRLARHLHSLREQLDAMQRMDDERNEWRVSRLTIDIEQAARLQGFVLELIDNLTPHARTWQEFGAWARGLLDRYLGGEGHRQSWPDDEIESHRAVQNALDALSALGDLRAEIDEATFRRALERELEAPAGRIGRFGQGVLVGRIADALGTDFEAVLLLGMTEGLMPPRERDDPLLPEQERIAGELPARAHGIDEQRRDYLAALAAAPERVLIFPRADLRGQRGRLPARWLLESASELEGRSVLSSDLERMSRRPWFEVVPSFEGALKDGLPPASAQEYDLRSLTLWCQGNIRAAEHYLAAADQRFAAGIDAETLRHRKDLSRWDGRVDGTGLRPTEAQAVSPTALQTWAACPFKYFLGHVLRVAETERPEETLELTPLERGNLVHEALERFIREAPARQAQGQPWNAGERALLMSICQEICDSYEAKGVTGKPLLWRMQRARIMRDLAGFLDRDEEMRREYGVVPAAVELAFGLQDAQQPAAGIDLGDGTRVAFRGRIDRIDRATDGKLLVTDYKTGRLWELYKGLDRDSVKGGELLQLPVYARAARDRFGDAMVDVQYWFVSEEQDYASASFPIDEDSTERFQHALRVILGGIEGGLFPARPGASREGTYRNCGICPYDRVCPSNRADAWRRKQFANELKEYVELAGD